MPVDDPARRRRAPRGSCSCVGSDPAESGSVIEKADLQVAGQQRVQPAVLLLGRAGQREDLRVARVGRLVAERDGRERRRAEDLVHQPELDLAEALAAELGVEVRGPQPARLDLLLQRRVDAVEPGLVELAARRLQRPDLLAHERRASSRAAPANSGSVEKSHAIGGHSAYCPTCDGAGAPRPADGDRRVVPPPGGPDVAHARGRGLALRGPAAALRRAARRAARAPAPRAALPPEAQRAAARASGRPLWVDDPTLQPRVPRAPDRAARARAARSSCMRLAARDLLPAARPLQAAVGDVAGRGPRGRPLRADLQDPPRADRRRRRRRPRARCIFDLGPVPPTIDHPGEPWRPAPEPTPAEVLAAGTLGLLRTGLHDSRPRAAGAGAAPDDRAEGRARGRRGPRRGRLGRAEPRARRRR